MGSDRAYRLRMVTRLASLIETAKTARYKPSIEQLAEQHGCCTRTIRRDLDVVAAVLGCERWWIRRERAA